MEKLNKYLPGPLFIISGILWLLMNNLWIAISFLVVGIAFCWIGFVYYKTQKEKHMEDSERTSKH